MSYRIYLAILGTCFCTMSQAAVLDVAAVRLEGVDTFFTVNELQVSELGSGTNLGVYSSATANSAGFGGPATGANDGVVSNGCCGNLWHGNGGPPQITFQFATPKAIDSLTLFGRQGCCPERDDTFDLVLLDSSGAEISRQTVNDVGNIANTNTGLAISVGSAIQPRFYDPVSVNLQNATATFNQSGFNVTNAIDGNFSSTNGWALAGGQNTTQSAVFQTDAPLNADMLRFDLAFKSQYGSHKAEDFRISYTTDENPTAGDASINWTEITPLSVATSLPDSDAILEAGNVVHITGNGSDNDIIEVLASGAFSDVTGFRLELLTGDDTVLGFSGNGNVVLTEFSVAAITTPEPTSLMAWSLFLGLAAWRFRSKTRRIS